jgi:hypothetical protein
MSIGSANMARPSGYQLLLRFECFVAFLGAALQVEGNQEAAVTLTVSTFGSEVVYEGVLDSEHTRHLLDEIESALGTYGTDPSWKEDGLDGVDIRGSFRSPVFSAQEFSFWSPRPATPPHRLVSAALDDLPVDPAHPAFEALEKLRAAVGTLSRR